MNARLTGRVAMVTGATGGIGPTLCRRLAQEGAAVGVCHEPSAEQTAQTLSAEIRAAGGSALPFVVDLADPGAAQQLGGRIHAALGPVDLLVCAAARSVSAQRPWRAFTPDDWNGILQVNVAAAAQCIDGAYDDLVASGRGSVVILSSVTPLFGRTGNLPYVTSKAALIGLTRALARECGVDGVRVNAIAPGAIQTPDEAVYGDPAELDAQVLALQSLKRRGVPADIASVVVFLASEDSAFVTGQLVVTDGGWIMA